jgi:hypothetical protein
MPHVLFKLRTDVDAFVYNIQAKTISSKQTMNNSLKKHSVIGSESPHRLRVSFASLVCPIS